MMEVLPVALIAHTTTTTLLLDELGKSHDESGVWAEFDARYRPILIGLCIRMGLNAEAAGEVAQETLVQFLIDYRAGKYVREQGRLRGWLIGICRHRVHDMFRQQGRASGQRGESVLRLLADDNQLEQTWEQIEERVIFERAMEVLRHDTKTNEQTVRVFELVALKGTPASTVASIIGIEVAEVYRIKNRITKKLRQIVSELTRAYASEG